MSNEKSMADVIQELAHMGLEFRVQKDNTKKLGLYVGEPDADGISMNQGTMMYLGMLPSDKFFVGMLRGQLVVREL